MSDDFVSTRVVLIRHGELAGSPCSVCSAGRAPAPACPSSALKQAERLRDRLIRTGEVEATALYLQRLSRRPVRQPT